MLFSLRSTALSSASIAASVSDESLLVDLAEPVVIGNPDELAVPALLVPGGGGEASFAALAGPHGTPLTPAVPAPAEPALGEPTALPVPADVLLEAPPALCANQLAGNIKIAVAAMATATDALVIADSLCVI